MNHSRRIIEFSSTVELTTVRVVRTRIFSTLLQPIQKFMKSKKVLQRCLKPCIFLLVKVKLTKLVSSIPQISANQKYKNYIGNNMKVLER